MHLFGHFQDGALQPAPKYQGRSVHYREAPLVDHTSGSVHTGLAIAELGPGGTLPPHVHAYEESFYILTG